MITKSVQSELGLGWANTLLNLNFLGDIAAPLVPLRSAGADNLYTLQCRICDTKTASMRFCFEITSKEIKNESCFLYKVFD